HLHCLRYVLANFLLRLMFLLMLCRYCSLDRSLWLFIRVALPISQNDFLLASELVDFLYCDFLSFGFLQLDRLRYELANFWLRLRFLLRLGRYCSLDRSLWLINWFGLFGSQNDFLLASELVDFLYCDFLSFGFLQLDRLRYTSADRRVGFGFRLRLGRDLVRGLRSCVC